MKISFQNTPRDWMAFYLFHSFRSFELVIWLVAFGMWLFILVGGLERAVPDLPAGVRWGVAVVLDLGLFAAAMALLMWSMQRRQGSQMNQNLYAPTTLQVEELALLVDTSNAHSEVQWSMVQKLARTGGHIFIYLSRAGALIVPNRAFGTETAREQFWALLQARVQAAQNAPSPELSQQPVRAAQEGLPLTLEYRLGFRDHLALTLYAIFRSLYFWGTALVLVLLPFKANVDAVMQVSGHRPLLWRAIMLIMMQLAPLGVFALLVAGLALVSIASRMNRTQHTLNRVTFGEGGIEGESAYVRSAFQWSMIKKVRRTRAYIYLFPQSRAAMVIPRRAFASQSAWDQFWESCQAKVRAAQEGQQRTPQSP
jgi:hypothetical protein